MNSRIAIGTTLTIALALVLVSSQRAFADKTHDGKVVSVAEGVAGADGKLVVQQKNSTNEDTYMIASTVKISLDKKKVELKDLKKGDEVKITTDDGGRVKEIVATRKKT